MSQRELGLSEEGRARRRFLKQAGTVAWASPLIVTMMSRSAGAQTVNCGTVDPNQSGVCMETAGACGTAQTCIPDVNPMNLGNCICATVPNP